MADEAIVRIKVEEAAQAGGTQPKPAGVENLPPGVPRPTFGQFPPQGLPPDLPPPTPPQPPAPPEAAAPPQPPGDTEGGGEASRLVYLAKLVDPLPLPVTIAGGLPSPPPMPSSITIANVPLPVALDSSLFPLPVTIAGGLPPPPPPSSVVTIANVPLPVSVMSSVPIAVIPSPLPVSVVSGMPASADSSRLVYFTRLVAPLPLPVTIVGGGPPPPPSPPTPTLSTAGAGGFVGVTAFVAAMSASFGKLVDATMSLVDTFTSANTAITNTVGGISASLSDLAASLAIGGAGIGGAIGAIFAGPIGGAVGAAVGATLGAPIYALSKAVDEFNVVLRNFDAMAQRYANVNPQIALAEASSQMQMLFGDIRRGQELAPDLIRYLQVRTEVQQKIEDMKVEFMKKMTPLVISGLRILESMLPLLEQIFDIPLVKDLLQKANAIGGTLAAINALLRGEVAKKDADILNAPTDLIMNNPNPLNFFGATGNQAGATILPRR